jgi:hypothetical protein
MNLMEKPNESLLLARDFIRNTEAYLFLTGKAVRENHVLAHLKRTRHE